MAAAPVKRDLELDPKYDHYDHPYVRAPPPSPRTGNSSLTPILVQISPTPQIGHPGYTTVEQDAKVHQLRMMLEAAGYKQNLDTLTMVGTAV